MWTAARITLRTEELTRCVLCSVIPCHDFLSVLWATKTRSSGDAPAAVQPSDLDTDGPRGPCARLGVEDEHLLLGQRAGKPVVGHVCGEALPHVLPANTLSRRLLRSRDTLQANMPGKGP